MGSVPFIGSNPAMWQTASARISAMVDAGFVVNSDVCPADDTSYYTRRDVCTNKTALARTLGVHILSDALLVYTPTATIPATTVCNPVTAANTTCSDAAVATLDAPVLDPTAPCDREQCLAAPAVGVCPR